MPTYEYACPKCGIVEVFQSIKEDALKKCPNCKSRVQRMMSLNAGGIIFKGSGFWETDYNRSADYQKKVKDETESAPTPPQTKTEVQTKKSDEPPAGSKPKDGGSKSGPADSGKKSPDSSSPSSESSSSPPNSPSTPPFAP